MKNGTIGAALAHMSRLLSITLLFEVQVLLQEMSDAVPYGHRILQFLAVGILADATHLRRMRPSGRIQWALRLCVALSILLGMNKMKFLGC